MHRLCDKNHRAHAMMQAMLYSLLIIFACSPGALCVGLFAAVRGELCCATGGVIGQIKTSNSHPLYIYIYIYIYAKMLCGAQIG